MKGVEDSSAAAQAILYEGGNGDLMKQVMTMLASPDPDPKPNPDHCPQAYPGALPGDFTFVPQTFSLPGELEGLRTWAS